MTVKRPGLDLDPPLASAQDERPEPPLTDYGNAERLVADHGSDLRFAPGFGWFAWDGRRWKRDTDGEVVRRAKKMVRTLYSKAADVNDLGERKRIAKWANDCESQARLAAAVKLAETEREVVVDPDALDANRFLLNVANGTVDLRTGDLREHRREDLLTKLTAVVYDPQARSDLWESFLQRATGGDSEFASFLQRAAGYSLTGDVSEEVLFFAHGPSARAQRSKHFEEHSATMQQSPTSRPS
jgi:putative DNA primase/helicase